MRRNNLPLQVTAIQILKFAGYTHFNKLAVNKFTEVIEIHMEEFLKSLISFTNHTSRSNTTTLDIYNMLGVGKINLIDFTTKKLEIKENFHIDFEHEFETDKSDFVDSAFANPIASKIERYIHVYEFMPAFPPTHTFKRTLPKDIVKVSRPERLKIKLEQIMKAERALVRMERRTKNIKNVNYMNGHIL